MKVNIISDLHCDVKDGKVEWMGFEPERLEAADYLIVAGDSGYAPTEHIIHRDLRNRTNGKFKKVLTIKGNHSYWVPNINYDIELDAAYETAMTPNDTIDVVDEDVAIIGTTLWTNAVSLSEMKLMNDYRHTPFFSPQVKLHRYKEESEWLRRKYNEYKDRGKKIVIVTHHNPRNSIILPEYSREHEDVHSAYWVYEAAEDWPDWETEIEKMSFNNFNKGLIKDVNDLKPDVWICGHIHEELDTEDNGTRFIRHPIGYRWGWYQYYLMKSPNRDEIVDSWYNKVVEI